eukprot:704995-Hanusia_phi.AAC.1
MGEKGKMRIGRQGDWEEGCRWREKRSKGRRELRDILKSEAGVIEQPFVSCACLGTTSIALLLMSRRCLQLPVRRGRGGSGVTWGRASRGRVDARRGEGQGWRVRQAARAPRVRGKNGKGAREMRERVRDDEAADSDRRSDCAGGRAGSSSQKRR